MGTKIWFHNKNFVCRKGLKLPFPTFREKVENVRIMYKWGDHLTNPLYKIEYKSFSSSLLTTHKLHTPPHCCACKNFWMMDRVISILAQTACSIPLLVVSRPPPLNKTTLSNVSPSLTGWIISITVL